MNEELNHGKHGPHGHLLFEEEAFLVRGAVFEVNREMGSGFLEAVYHECLVNEFARRNIPHISKPSLKLSYKGQVLEQVYVPDFVCFDRMVLELKAVREIAPEHRAQVMNYLKASGLRLGLLANFGSSSKAQIERFVL